MISDWISKGRVCLTNNQVNNQTEQTKGEFIFLEHASRWLGQSVGIPGRDKSFGVKTGMLDNILFLSPLKSLRVVWLPRR
ncbi:hypothetical protein HanOQP8_Chr15g0575801 [Helianthus annuus]|nr:hypothetical protein HanOQP8_Chr15g0575801 [Helianthus annuus]